MQQQLADNSPANMWLTNEQIKAIISKLKGKDEKENEEVFLPVEWSLGDSHFVL